MTSPSTAEHLNSHRLYYDLCKDEKWDELLVLLRESSPTDTIYQDFCGGGGNTVLHEALELDAPLSVVSLLVEKAPGLCRVCNKYGDWPVHLAASCHPSRLPALLVETDCMWALDRLGRTLLHLLYTRRPRPDEPGPLYSTLQQDPTQLEDDTAITTYACADVEYHVTQLVLDRLEPDAVTRYLHIQDTVRRRTPLHEACAQPTVSYPTLQLLLRAAGPTTLGMEDVHGNTALHLLLQRLDMEDYDDDDDDDDDIHSPPTLSFQDLLDSFISNEDAPTIFQHVNHLLHTPLAHAIFHFAPYSVVKTLIPYHDTLLWHLDSSQKTTLQLLLHLYPDSSLQVEQIQDLVHTMMYFMLEQQYASLHPYPHPPPWDDSHHRRFLLHNCFRLKSSCPPFDFINSLVEKEGPFIWNELDSWGFSSRQVFVQSLPSLVTQWSTKEILFLWSSCCRSADPTSITTISSTLLSLTMDRTYDSLWIQMYQRILRVYPRVLLDQEYLGHPSWYPYLIHIVTRKSQEEVPSDDSSNRALHLTSIYLFMRDLPELFLCTDS